MPVPAIQFENVSKSYREQTVLSEIDLTVNDSEYVGLVGMNGAGKSTLIKCLLDFTLIDSGAIKIFGVGHRDNKSRAGLTFLPEKFVPPYYLTGRDFLSYMMELHGVRKDEQDIRTVLEVLDLEFAALKKSVRQYSKGMVQKLGLASCFLSDKPLLLLDEPMSGLDPKARTFLKQHLLALKKQGKTLFFSTHLLADVEVLCDRIAILHDSTIKFFGTPQQCCQRYECQELEQAFVRCIES